MERILSQIKALPSMPEIVCQLTKLIDKPGSTAQDLARVISKDQSLTARILRLVNSSYYAFRSKVSKVSHAISLMGFIALKNIVLGLSLIDAFRRKDGTVGLDHDRFWEHSLGTAATAQAIAEKSGKASPEEAYVAGLLHDIGKVILDITLPEEYSSALSEARRTGLTMRQAEQEYFGYTHSEVGGELAKMWNLPEQLQRAINGHHIESLKDPLTMIVNVANNLCKASGAGFSGDPYIQPVNDDIWINLDVYKESISSIFSELKKEVIRTKIFLGMHTSQSTDDRGSRIFHLRSAPSFSIMLASSNLSRISIPALILEENNYIVKTSDIPIKMTRDEKREISLILIECSKGTNYPDEAEVQIGDNVVRRIPIAEIPLPFSAEELLEMVNTRIALSYK